MAHLRTKSSTKVKRSIALAYSTYVKVKARGPDQALEGVLSGPQDDI